jgi:hypothetical protein
MSTGDQTEYIRGKMAERGSRNDARFMKDGFDRWAESSEPARDGQEEKIPAETQMAGRGGALSLKEAKMLELGAKRVGKKAMKVLEGGDLMATGREVVSRAKQILDVWRGISSFYEKFKRELDGEIAQNEEYEVTKPKLVAFARRFSKWLESLEVYKNTLDSLASMASTFGLGKSRRRGGSMTPQDVAKYAQQIGAMYLFLKDNAENIRVILRMRALEPVGQQILNVLDPVMKAVGMGRGGVKVDFTGEGGVKPIGEDFEEEKEYFMVGPHRMSKAGPSKVYAEERVAKFGGRKRPMLGGMEFIQAPSGVDLFKPVKAPQVRTRMRKQKGPLGEDLEFADFYLENGSGRMPRDAQISRGMGRMPSRPVGGATCGGKKPSARGAIVKKVMAEHGLSLPQASKYVKEKGLY